jgi:flagellar basal body rod protein FlgG
VRAADTNTLNKVEQRIWEASLSDLSEKARAELLEIRNRVGSIATPFIPGLDDIDVVEVRQEPHAFPISDDGSLVEILPSPFPTIQQVNNIQATSAIVEAAQNLYQQELLNQHTIGFKRSELIVTSPLTAGDFSPPEPVFIDETATKWLVRLDVSPGVNIETGNPLDIAIRGSGWLQVKLACGNLGYTRAGVLRLDKEQRLCIRTSGGLLPISPEIKLPPHASLEINATGTVSVSTPTGEPIESGTIQIFNFRDATLLQRLASGCYTANADTGKAYPVACQQAGQQTWIEAGHVEQSNAQVHLANKQLTQLQDLEQAIR